MLFEDLLVAFHDPIPQMHVTPVPVYRESLGNGTDLRGLPPVIGQVIRLHEFQRGLRVILDPSCHPGGQVQSAPGFCSGPHLIGDELVVHGLFALGQQQDIEGMPVSQPEVLQGGPQLLRGKAPREFPDLVVGGPGHLKMGEGADLLVPVGKMPRKKGGALPRVGLPLLSKLQDLVHERGEGDIRVPNPGPFRLGASLAGAIGADHLPVPVEGGAGLERALKEEITIHAGGIPFQDLSDPEPVGSPGILAGDDNEFGFKKVIGRGGGGDRKADQAGMGRRPHRRKQEKACQPGTEGHWGPLRDHACEESIMFRVDPDGRLLRRGYPPLRSELRYSTRSTSSPGVINW